MGKYAYAATLIPTEKWAVLAAITVIGAEARSLTGINKYLTFVAPNDLATAFKACSDGKD